ncbi:FecR family protein [Pseudoflavitalea rhizosphaerae]|uniref:FecR family protein n=1 Tax=Pseudoflavitalea rhizosphaerae TaxID=1884793 RepID=UPI000F8F5953|nr:FecR family protein [Pseudoflavitalea rhizosphaerae]
MDKSELAYLLNRYADNTISESEKEVLITFLQSGEDQELALEAGEAFLDAHVHSRTDLLPYSTIAQQILDTDRVELQPQKKGRLLRMAHLARIAAAAVLLALATGIWWWDRAPEQPPAVADVKPVNDIAPGKEGAILTRTDGSKLVLDQSGKREIKDPSGASMLLDNGKITYTNNTVADVTSLNTISTPNGKTFQVLLEDGSRVWLNAGSSVTYPMAFTKGIRKVKVTGEVYIDVAKIANSPFQVNVDDRAEVEVLGTSFNINAYQDEPIIKTTLVDGAVKVLNGNRSQSEILKPGQLAKLDKNGKISTGIANINEVTAWRNGLFHFSNANVEEIMRQLSRWYDVEVKYDGGIPVRTFSGEIGRQLSLQQVLAILRTIRINYTIDNDKQITIKKS